MNTPATNKWAEEQRKGSAMRIFKKLSFDEVLKCREQIYGDNVGDPTQWSQSDHVVVLPQSKNIPLSTYNETTLTKEEDTFLTNLFIHSS
jgi:hypothetical protein